MELETTLSSTFATNTKASWSEYPTPYVGFSAMLTGVSIMILCGYLFIRNVTPTFHVLAVFLFLSILVGMQWTWAGFRTLSPARRTDSISANVIKDEMSSFHALAEAAQMYHRVGYQDELLSVDLSMNSDITSYLAASVVFFLSLYIILAGMRPALFPLTWVSILLIPITTILVLLIPFAMANRERARVLNKCLTAEKANSLLELITKPWGGLIGFLEQCRACGPDVAKPLALYHHNWYSIVALFIQFARKTSPFRAGMQSARRVWHGRLPRRMSTVHVTTIPVFHSNLTPSFGEANTFLVTDLRSGTDRFVLLWTP
jgi:hypothetical protein